MHAAHSGAPESMVLASHCILTMYGFWLPNEERGSWSTFVRSWELYERYGKATKIDHRHSVAMRPYDRDRRREAIATLKYHPVRLSGDQARAIGRDFASAITEASYTLLACAILPRHTHLVSARHHRPVEKIIGHLKSRATQQLRAEGLHPFERFRDASDRIPSVWTHRAWKVFLNSDRDIQRAVDYVNANPLKDGKPAQRWSFVAERSRPASGAAKLLRDPSVSR
jgi:REP element-mobilizing transposase RayT